MANICSCYLEICGKSVSELSKVIKAQDHLELEKLFTWFIATGKDIYYGLETDLEDLADEGELTMDFTCKWSPPIDDLKSLSGKYPDLSIFLRYEEPGCELYGTVKFQGGGIIEEVSMTHETYLYETDEDFMVAMDYIKCSAYSMFLEDLKDIDDLDEDTQGDSYLERAYVERLKPEDLPLLMGHEWVSESNQEYYLKRLKGDSITLSITTTVTTGIPIKGD